MCTEALFIRGHKTAGSDEERIRAMVFYRATVVSGLS